MNDKSQSAVVKEYPAYSCTVIVLIRVCTLGVMSIGNCNSLTATGRDDVWNVNLAVET